MCVGVGDEGTCCARGHRQKDSSVSLLACPEILLHVLRLTSPLGSAGKEGQSFHEICEIPGSTPLRRREKCGHQILFLSFLTLRKLPNGSLSVPS